MIELLTEPIFNIIHMSILMALFYMLGIVAEYILHGK